jgi:hypothetical protein
LLKTIDEELRRRRRLMYSGSALIGVLAAAAAIPIFATFVGYAASFRGGRLASVSATRTGTSTGVAPPTVENVQPPLNIHAPNRILKPLTVLASGWRIVIVSLAVAAGAGVATPSQGHASAAQSAC